MHYYQFNIGDYASHTQHLDPLEDIAYRRMLDYLYLNESKLPESVEEIARLIRMRTHCESIAVVLQEFFVLHSDGYSNKRVDAEIAKFRDKSDKAKLAAESRWGKNPSKSAINTDADALQTHCEGNTNHKPITNNHKPIKKTVRFVPPSVDEVAAHVMDKGYTFDPGSFVAFYESNGWMVGKNKMKSWKAACVTWEKRNDNEARKPEYKSAYQQRVEDIQRRTFGPEATDF